MAIQTLIDKKDNVEIIRDQIASILVSEVANQMVLATNAGKDPNDWKLRVYTERHNPWETWLNDQSDPSPLINVWIDNINYDPSGSNTIERQKTEAIFNIDCYGLGISADVNAGGHTPGDQEAAFSVQKAIKLVRNILMAAEYTYLGMQGLVWHRWPQSVTIFQPQLNAQDVQQVVGARVTFRVVFNELSPQVVPDVLDYLAIDVIRVEDGQIVLEADYDYTI